MMASMEAVSDSTVVVTVVHDCQVSHVFPLFRLCRIFLIGH